MVEQIKAGSRVLAIIIRNNFNKNGVSFFTPDEFSQQLAFMKHPSGKIIPPHIHNQIQRTVLYTKEVLFIRKGRLKVDFYDNNKQYKESAVLAAGDVILLAGGGHGFEVLEDVEMIEVKQGPYAGANDKTIFEGKLLQSRQSVKREEL